jgi:hypothetical protein
MDGHVPVCTLRRAWLPRPAVMLAGRIGDTPLMPAASLRV